MVWFRYGVDDVTVDSLPGDAVKEPLMPRATTFGALALVALALAGCTGPDQTPTDTGTTAEVSSSPSPSAVESSPAPTPVVVAPERPAAMDDDGYEGAQAAAKYFLSLDDYIMKTGDTAEWERMSHAACDFCAERLEQAQIVADEGHLWTGGANVTSILHTYEQDEPTGVWPIDIRVTVAPTRVVDASGDEVYTSEEVTAERRLEVVKKSDQWTIINLYSAPSATE